MKTFASVEELAAAAGTTIGPGQWRTIDQHRVDTFADATDDHQWIHVDPQRAAAGPFGGTIAHGYLTLSLLPSMVGELFSVSGVRMGVNYGSNKVRFPAPVRVGAKIRATAELVSVEPVDGGVQVVTRVTVQTDGGGKPACVADTVSRLYV
jgi:acyl dehydratase